MPLDLANTPALRPPPGVIPDLDNPEDHSAETWTIVGFIFAFTTSFVLLRLYVKEVLIKQREWEDYLFVLAWAGLLAEMIYWYQQPVLALGSHQWNVSIADLMAAGDVVYYGSILYNLILMIVKAALVLQFLHIFAPNKSYRLWWPLWILLGVTVVFHLLCALLRVFACIPGESYGKVTGVTCVDPQDLFLIPPSFNVASDLVILALPISQTWKLQMSTSRRVGVTAIFATGIFAVVSSIMHIVVGVWQIQTGDDIYYGRLQSYWCYAETASGIFCGCMPVMPRFYRQHISPTFSLLTSSVRKLSRTGDSSTFHSSSKQSTAQRHWPSASTTPAYLETEEVKDVVLLSDAGQISRLPSDSASVHGRSWLTSVHESKEGRYRVDVV